MPIPPHKLKPPLEAQRAWRRRGETMVRDLSFRDFDAAMAFLQRFAPRAEDWKRHPDVSVSRGQVRLTIENPHHAGITLAELRLAAKVNAAIEDAA
jgi:4a-hydroxytetrahydrobiopterin dehydratase